MKNNCQCFLFYKLFIVFFAAYFSFFTVAKEQGRLGLEEEDIETSNEDFLRKVKKLKPKKFSDLVHLSPFSDVAVIQRRFMPKTGRVSIAALSTFVLSSEYFLHPGIEGHLTYHFLEKHGIELSGYYVFTISREVTNELEDIGVRVKELKIFIKSFVGLTYKWMPVYGKIAFYNNQVLSFDTFFNLGGGMSTISGGKVPQITWEPTVVAGIGQVFAITRDLGLRWDLRVHMTIPVITKTSSNAPVFEGLFSIGLNYYYPSAGLR